MLKMARIAAVVLVLASFASIDAAAAVAKTPLGTVVGEDNGEYRVWRGMRYAEPPARWQVAVPKKQWSGTFNATEFGDACILDTKVHGPLGFSEDCLFANVWAPSQVSEALPVVVFIHGGGFLIGSGADPRLWGDLFVTDPTNPVIYVTFNYRMGILGFYSGEAGANFGFQDQQLGLRFVQENIAAFSGRPDDITLVGQSAGAMSVQIHLVAPGSRGLFQRAYLASTVGLHYRSLEENKPFVDSAAHAVNCFGLFWNQTECMRSRSATVLDAAAVASGILFHLQTDCDECDNLLPWLPVVDGDVIPRSPLEMLRDGDHANVPVVISTVRNESWAFIPGILHGLTDKESGYNLAMNVLFRNNAETVKKHYAEAVDSAGMSSTSKLGLALSDALFTCYGRYIARLLSQSSPTFLSTFMHAPSAHADPGNAGLDSACEKGVTCHASDLSWIFPGSPEMSSKTSIQLTNEEFDLAMTYSAALRGFAYGDYSSVWLPYLADEDRGLIWGNDGFNISGGYHKDHCDFFEQLGFPTHAWNQSRPVVVVA